MCSSKLSLWESQPSHLQVSTVLELLRLRTEQEPERRAYTFLLNGETETAHFTYAELDRRARAIGVLLQEHATQGERALLLYPPGLDFIAAFFGCLYAGVIAVPVYPPDPSRLDRTLSRFLGILKDAQPAVIITTAPILAMTELLFELAPELRTLKWLATDSLNDDLAAAWQDPKLDSNALAFFQYTSGSTATPKGVMVSHGNILHNQVLIQSVSQQTEQSVFVSWVPTYHDMGLMGPVFHSLYVGFPSVLMSPIDFLKKPIRWLQAISRYRATISCAPSFAYDLCVRKITQEQRSTLDLSSWELALNGSEPIRPDSLEHFASTFESCGFRREALYPAYGLAEATCVVSAGIKLGPLVIENFHSEALEQQRVRSTTAQDKNARLFVSCGSSFGEQKIVIVDPETCTLCPPGHIGEIWISGSSVAQGYWNRPEETKETFRAYLQDTGHGPFLRTGDLGFLQEGELFVTGRLKDMIIINGVNHYPQDIERTVEQSYPPVRSGCSAAFSADVDGEERLVVAAEIQTKHSDPDPKDRQCYDLKDAIRSIRRSVSREHNLNVTDIVLLQAGSIPKTSSGKIQRHKCREQFGLGELKVLGI